MRSVHLGPVTGVVGLVAVLATLEAVGDLTAAGWVVGLTAAGVANALLAVGLWRSGAARMGAANWVTLVRATLGQAVAALVAVWLVGGTRAATLVPVAVVALALDAVDGKVAKRARGVTVLGARFDMEADAFLLLVLSLAVAPAAGWWVLLIGGARYLLLAAECAWPWLRAPVPPRYWRKVVAAIQGVTLVTAVAGVLSDAATTAMLLLALGLLAESFGHDVLWLRHRRRSPSRQPVLDASLEPALGPAGR